MLRLTKRSSKTCTRRSKRAANRACITGGTVRRVWLEAGQRPLYPPAMIKPAPFATSRRRERSSSGSDAERPLPALAVDRGRKNPFRRRTGTLARPTFNSSLPTANRIARLAPEWYCCASGRRLRPRLRMPAAGSAPRVRSGCAPRSAARARSRAQRQRSG
jgi:hypothetical protein